MIFMNTFGRAHARDSDDAPPNYNSLSGFGPSTERIDPHTHVQPAAIVPDLTRIAELVRPRQVSPESAAPNTTADESKSSK